MENVDPFIGIFAPNFNFVLFLVVAYFVFRKMAKAAAKKKREDFQLLLKESQRAKNEADAKLAELNARMANLDKEVEEIKATAKKGAQIQASKIVQDAQNLSSHLKEEAKRIANAEIDKARNALRQEVVTAVAASVTQKAKTSLDASSHKSLVDKRIGSLSALRVEV